MTVRSSQTEPQTEPLSRQKALNFPAVGAVTLSHISVDLQTGSLPLMLPTLLVALHLNFLLAGGIIAANQIVIAIAQPLFGILGDKKSFKWMVPVGATLTALGMAAVLWMPSYPLVITCVLLSGLGSAMFHPEALSRVRANSGSKTASGTSIFFSGGNIGFGLAPIFTALLLERLGKPYLLLLIVPTLIGLVLMRWQWASIRQNAPVKRSSTTGSGRVMWGLVAYLMLLITMRSTVTGGLTAYLPLGHDALELSKDAAATLVTIISLSGIVGTLAGGVVADRIGKKPMMLITAVISLCAMLTFPHVDAFYARALLLGVVGLCSSAAWPTIVILIQDAMPGMTGLASGLSLGTVYAATGLGVAALGAYADHAGIINTIGLISLLPIAVVILTALLPNKMGQDHPENSVEKQLEKGDGALEGDPV